jgi:DNA end-binding protein Ku
MASRPIWRGHLRLALVSCPVALYAAHTGHGDLHFHFINPATGNRVRMVTLDAETGDEISRNELARGYEFRKDEYVVLSDDDFAAVRIESSTVLSVEKFVPADAIDPLCFDTGYYLAPDGKEGVDVYAVLRQAIAASKRIALSRVVIARRERAIAIRPSGDGFVAHTLFDTRDIQDPAELFGAIGSQPAEPEMVRLATQLIDRQTARFSPADMEDRYEARLRAMIDAKLKGEGIGPEEEPEVGRGKVVDLMQALKQSLRAAAPAKPKARTRKRA